MPARRAGASSRGSASFASGSGSGRRRNRRGSQPSGAQAHDTVRLSRRWWQEVPAWAQVAAALLFLGVSAGIANLDVQYDRDGLAVRTGWSAPAPPPAADAQPWRADLANLDMQLRAEIRAASQRPADTEPAGRQSSDASEAVLMQRVKTLIDQSERKEQSELALRVAEMFRDMQAQRQADLAKIDRSLGLIQNNTGFEVMRQRELLNSLAVRVSQTR